MKSILIVCDSFHDSTSFYRAVGPLSRLKRDYPGKYHFSLAGGTLSWAEVSLCDVVFALRPSTDEHLKILKLAQSLGKPIWIDYDDDLTQVPENNPAHTFYSSARVQDNIFQCMDIATVMSVSTKYLAVRYSQVKESTVIPNALDENLFQRERTTHEREPIVFWRGSPTHDKDLAQYTHAMDLIAKKNQDAQFLFMGNPLWLTLERVERAKRINPATILEYLKTITRLSPKIVQVPLWDCPFNRSKSNIAHLESSFAGALTLAPDWEEWQIPGVMNYTDESSYLYCLQNMLWMSHEDHQKKVDEGWKYIEENLVLSKTNQLRKRILDSFPPFISER